jgi:hypothetical protein
MRATAIVSITWCQASWAGMVTCNWAPGKKERSSTSGTSSSHAGTMAIRAVPLRTLILPCHRCR